MLFYYSLLIFIILIRFLFFHLSSFQIEYFIKKSLVMAASNASETVRVITRCRPMNQREIDLKCQVGWY